MRVRRKPAAVASTVGHREHLSTQTMSCAPLQPADTGNPVRDSRGCHIEALELIVHKIDARGSLWVQGQETLGLDQSLAIELSGGLRVGIHQGTKALGELGRKRLIVGPGAAN